MIILTTSEISYGGFMFSKVFTCALNGLDGYLVRVEADISNGIPAFDIVGLAGTPVKEARERVKAAINNSGYRVSNEANYHKPRSC